MSPQEFWAIERKRRPPERIGKMTKQTFDHLVAVLNGG
jgi:hypothetical protein